MREREREREGAAGQLHTRRVFRQSEDLWSPRSRRFRCSFNLVAGVRAGPPWARAGRARPPLGAPWKKRTARCDLYTRVHVSLK